MTSYKISLKYHNFPITVNRDRYKRLRKFTCGNRRLEFTIDALISKSGFKLLTTSYTFRFHMTSLPVKAHLCLVLLSAF